MHSSGKVNRRHLECFPFLCLSDFLILMNSWMSAVMLHFYLQALVSNVAFRMELIDGEKKYRLTDNCRWQHKFILFSSSELEHFMSQGSTRTTCTVWFSSHRTEPGIIIKDYQLLRMHAQYYQIARNTIQYRAIWKGVLTDYKRHFLYVQN